MVLLQNVQDPAGADFIGTIVKGEGHHGLGGVDDADVGFLRLNGRLFRRSGGLLRFPGLGSGGLQGLGLSVGRIGGCGPAHAGSAGQQHEEREKKRKKTVHFMDFLRRYLTK
jgi:hypothetical protein